MQQPGGLLQPQLLGLFCSWFPVVRCFWPHFKVLVPLSGLLWLEKMFRLAWGSEISAPHPCLTTEFLLVPVLYVALMKAKFPLSPLAPWNFPGPDGFSKGSSLSDLKSFKESGV